jgi:hypothetical protein
MFLNRDPSISILFMTCHRKSELSIPAIMAKFHAQGLTHPDYNWARRLSLPQAAERVRKFYILFR